MDQNIWTVLLTYSFVQGYILGVYTLIRFKRIYLSLLLIIISTQILVHLYYHFDWFVAKPHFIFLDAPLWYLIGPFFYFFTKGIFQLRISKWEYLHYLPALGFVFYLGPFLVLEGYEKTAIFDQVFSTETYSGDLNHYFFSAHIFIYVYYSYLLFKRKSLEQKQESAQTNLIFDSLASRVLKYYVICTLAGFLFYLFTDVNYSIGVIYYPVYYFFLSVLIHLVFYFALVRWRDPDDSEINPTAQIVTDSKYISSSLTADEMNSIVTSVIAYVSKYEVYKNPGLRLRNVSDHLNIPSHHISQSINQVLKKSFFDVVNEQRVKGIKETLLSDRYRNYTLMAVAGEFGFKSPSSFYRIFKNYTGVTPKEYVKAFK